MTQLPAVPSVLRLEFTSSQGTSLDIMNRIYYRWTGTAPSTTNIAQFCNSAHGYFHTDLLPVLCQTYYLQKTVCTDLSSSTAYQYEVATPYPGLVASAPMPPGDCMLVNYKIARRYRGGHPRWYQSGLELGATDDAGKWLASRVQGYQTAHNAFLNHIASQLWSGATGLHHCSVSYYQGFTAHQTPSGRYKNLSKPRATPVIDDVLGTDINPIVTSQRRRDQVP